MRDLVHTETHLAIEHITKRILDLEECIVKDYGIEVRDQFIQKIKAICSKLKVSLKERRKTKLDKLCIAYQSQNEDPRVTDTTAIVGGTSDTSLAPVNSQIDRFLTDIRAEVDNKVTPILVEDLGPEETLHGINPLPIDSPLLLVDVVDVGRNRDGSVGDGRIG